MPLARTPSFHRITLLLGALFLARAVNGCAESPAPSHADAIASAASAPSLQGASSVVASSSEVAR